MSTSRLGEGGGEQKFRREKSWLGPEGFLGSFSSSIFNVAAHIKRGPGQSKGEGKERGQLAYGMTLHAKKKKKNTHAVYAHAVGVGGIHDFWISWGFFTLS